MRGIVAWLRTPTALHRLALVALAANVAIVLTGAAVRLTGSGLGCPDWPTCEGGRLTGELSGHQAIEFLNRMFALPVLLASGAALLTALVQRPRRRDLTLLAAGLVGGVLGQAVLGGLTVLFDLRWPLVGAHFLLSMAILLDAFTLVTRAKIAAGGAPPTPVTGSMRAHAIAVTTLAGLVILIGVLVTAAGPHSGSEGVERLDVAVGAVARIHGVLALLTIATAVLLARRAAETRLGTAALVLTGILVLQGGVGYLQYFTGVPAALVEIHVAGAVATWLAALTVRHRASRPGVVAAVHPERETAADQHPAGFPR